MFKLQYDWLNIISDNASILCDVKDRVLQSCFKVVSQDLEERVHLLKQNSLIFKKKKRKLFPLLHSQLT